MPGKVPPGIPLSSVGQSWGYEARFILSGEECGNQAKRFMLRASGYSFSTSAGEKPMPSGSLPAVSEPAGCQAARSTTVIRSALAWAT